jgi:hypothetical protein
LELSPPTIRDCRRPAHLNETERAVFRDIVGSADRGHFRSEDREMLALYSIHVAELRRLATHKRRSPAHMQEIRTLSKLVMDLSVKLRIGPKSRAPDHRRAASAGMRPPPSYYDTMRTEAAPQEQAPARGDDRWT